MAQIRRPGNSTFRLVIMALIFFTLVGGTVIIMRPMDLAIRKSMAEIRDNFIQTAENFTGRKLEYGSMSPSVFGTLDIHNICLRRDDGSPFLTISRLRISYSFLNIIRGKINEGLKSVRIDWPAFTLDFSKDRDLFDLFSSGDLSLEMDGQNLLPENFQIRLRNGELETRGSLGYVSLRNFNLDGSIRNSRIIFNSRWNALGAINTGGGQSLLSILLPADGASFSLSSNGRANGDFNLNLEEGNGTITIPSFTGDSFRFEPISLSVFLRNRKLEIRKVYDKSPADFAAIWDMESNDFNLTFSGEDFLPRDLLILTGSWRDYDSWTSLHLSGHANLEMNEDFMRYAVDLSGALPQGLGFGNMSFAINADGNEERIDIHNLLVNSPSGKISYEGSFDFNTLAPAGLLSISNLKLLENGDSDKTISGNFYITSSGREIRLLGENFSSGTVAFSALDASVYRSDSGLSFICSVLRDNGSMAESQGVADNSRVFLEGSVDYNPWYIEASLKLDYFSLQDVIDFLYPVVQIPVLPEMSRSIIENIHLTTELFFTVDNQHSLYNAPTIAIFYSGTQLADFSLSGTDYRFDLNQGLILLDNANLGLSGHVDFTNPHDISVSFEFSYQDLAYYVRGVVLDGQSVSMYGSYGFELFFSSAGTREYSGYIKGDNIPIPSGDHYAQLSFFSSLRYASASFWSLDLDVFELTGLAVQSPTANTSLVLFGSADQDGLLISRIIYSDYIEPLIGSLSVTWDSSYRDFNLNLSMDNNNFERREEYGLGLFFSMDDLIELNFSVENMQLVRFIPDISNGRVTGDISATYNFIDSFRVELFLESVAFQFQEQMLNFSAQAYLDDSDFLIEDFQANLGSDLRALVPHLSISRLDGRAETSARLWGFAAGKTIDFSIQAQADFVSPETWFDLGNITNSLHGSLVFSNAQYGTKEAEDPFLFAFSSVRDEKGLVFSVDGGPRNMLRFSYTPEDKGGGIIYAALSAPSPLRGSFTGFIDSNTIDLRVPDLYADMGALWEFVPPLGFIAFPGGTVTASLHITGPLRDPEFYGSARASSLRIQVPDYIPDDIRPVPVNITLEGNEMRFGPVSASISDGLGVVTAWYQFERWIPRIFSMDFNVPAETTIPVAFDVGGIITTGRTSGYLNLSMDDTTFMVSGDLVAQNTEITLDYSDAAVQSREYSDSINTVVDIIVRSGRQVEFYWPSLDWPIIHANADQGTAIHIYNDTDARRFSLTGDVKLRSGEVFYMERNFYLRQGTLFFNENETSFEPHISARAEIRDQSDTGPVTISMIIDNAPLVSFEPRFESSPALSQLEIYSLLGQNQAGNVLDAGKSASLIISLTADALTQFTVMRPVERAVRNFLGLDMFSMRTRVLQNVVLQAAGLQVNSGSAFNIGNYLDNTTVFMGKYIGANFFLEGLVSLKYDPEKPSWNGLLLEPELGLETRIPGFLVDLNFRMNFGFPFAEAGPINDIALSLVKGWTF